MVEGTNNAVTPSCSQGSYIKYCSDSSPSAPNCTAPRHLPTITVKWCYPNQSGYFPSIQTPQLWQLSDNDLTAEYIEFAARRPINEVRTSVTIP